MELQGKVAFITGAAQGMGKGFAEALLEKGVKVFFVDVNAEVGIAAATTLSERFGPENVKFVQLDVTDHQKFTVLVSGKAPVTQKARDYVSPDVFKQAVSEFGHVDIMVNNAGILDETRWELAVQINYVAMVHGTKLAEEHMRKDRGGRGGRIINNSSSTALGSYPFVPVYCGTKHAVRAFTVSMAEQPDVTEKGIEYAVLCPDVVDTPFIKNLDESKAYCVGLLKEMCEETKMPLSSAIAGFMDLLHQPNMNRSILLIKDGMSYRTEDYPVVEKESN